MFRSDITMTTSEHLPMGDSKEMLHGAAAELPLSGSLPDLAAMTQLANEFFRAMPGRSSLPAAVPSGLPTGSAMPIAAPSLTTQLPQVGAALSSMPAVPSIGRFPSEADAHRIAGTPVIPFEIASLPISGGPVSGAASGFPAISPYSSQYAPADSAVSPFSMPLPAFDAGLPSFEPLFSAPSLPTDAQSRILAASAPKTANSFYFLDDAGLHTKPPVQPASAPSQGPRAGSAPDLQLPRRQFDIGSVRRDFPILRERVNGKPLIWLDNAATTQKPQSVIDRVSYFYEHENSNIHRAAHELAARAPSGRRWRSTTTSTTSTRWSRR